jgi:probable rRNA maturation factor
MDPRFHVAVANRQRTRRINARHLKQIAAGLFAELALSRAELGLNLVADAEMTRINETYLRHEGTTDVITFDYLAPCPLPPAPELHGELFICVDEAVRQARRFRTTWQAEVVRYTIHGVLHLLGHDDLKPALRRKMKRAENRLVRQLARQFACAKISGARK